MATEQQIKNATAVYNTVCAKLDEMGIQFDKRQEDCILSFVMQGDDFPINIMVQVDASRSLISLYSELPYVISEDARTAVAIAVSVANYNLVDGSFDYNYSEGKIYFRMTSSFLDSIIGPTLIEYMFFISITTIEKYNDKFFLVSKTLPDTDDIIKMIEDDEE